MSRENERTPMGRPARGPQGRFRQKEKLKNPKGTLKRMLKYLSSKISSLVFVFILSLSTTLITIFGTRLNGYTVDNFISTGDMKGLAGICIVLIIIYVISAACTYGQKRIMAVSYTHLSIKSHLS